MYNFDKLRLFNYYEVMRKDKYLAFQLRKDNKSYNYISKELTIPKSTLHYWFRDNDWSIQIKKDLTEKAKILARPKLRLMALANKKKWDEKHLEYQKEARNEFPLLIKNQIFLVGLMLYWGEGDKVLKNGIVRLSNSDPEMIKVFYLFLYLAVGIPKEKIMIKLTRYPDLMNSNLRKFWSKTLDISLIQFKNSVVILGKHPTKRLSYGVCSVEVYSRELKEKIITWLRLYQEYFSQSI